MSIPKNIIVDDPGYSSSGKLIGMTAVITGGDSGIGAAAALCMAKEGANIVINYLDEDKDADKIVDLIKRYNGNSEKFKGDISVKQIASDLVEYSLDRFGSVDILINNAGTQTTQENLEDISEEQLEKTFRTNLFGMFYTTQVALPHMRENSTIINTTSVTAYRGSEELIDYSSTKGAIVSFTRSLSTNLASKKIRVNAVAPGPVWTPLVLTSFDDEKLSTFGKDQPLGRAAQPYELGPAYVFLASSDSQYMTGQVLHINGGEIING